MYANQRLQRGRHRRRSGETHINYNLLFLSYRFDNLTNIQLLKVINKQNDCPFTPNDEQVFAAYLQFCGIGLRNAQLYERSQLEVKRNQVLLDLARMIFEEQSTIEHMVLRILTHTQSLIQCQRVQVRTSGYHNLAHKIFLLLFMCLIYDCLL